MSTDKHRKSGPFLPRIPLVPALSQKQAKIRIVPFASMCDYTDFFFQPRASMVTAAIAMTTAMICDVEIRPPK